MPVPDELTGGHLSPEDLSAYLQGLSAPEERARVLRHLATCLRCYRELLAILRLLHEPEDRG